MQVKLSLSQIEQNYDVDSTGECGEGKSNTFYAGQFMTRRENLRRKNDRQK